MPAIISRHVDLQAGYSKMLCVEAGRCGFEGVRERPAHEDAVAYSLLSSWMMMCFSLAHVANKEDDR